MSPLRFSSRVRSAVVPGAVALSMLVAAAPVGGAASGQEPADPRVRLTADRGTVVRSAEVPVAPGEQRLRTTTYSMVAATWHGPTPRVSVRTDAGAWRVLPVLADLPDPESGEPEEGLGATELLWTGPQRGIDVRVEGGQAADVELVLIDPGERPVDTHPTADTSSLRRTTRERPDVAPRPELRKRRAWGADPSWRNGKPRYNDKLKQIHLHHTATGNDYRRKDVPGIIRGMYRYHTQTLGWFDIGYNFLVDKFGRTWVGRSGGPARLVRGAHTLGFNHISVGVAVIGNYEDRRPGRDVVKAVQRLAAWKLDRRERRATGKVWVRSQGSDKYPEGERVRLPAFDGHRDTNDTACPGDRLYDKLPRLRRMTQRRIERFS